MSSKAKISLIWFRDDEPARRMRLHPGWLRALTYLAVCLALLAVGGAYSGWEFWQRARKIAEEKRDVDKRLAETLLQVERLENIDKLLRTSDPSELSQLLAGLGVAMPAGKAPTVQTGASKKDQGKKDQQPERERPAGFDLADILSKVDLGQVGVENFRFKVDGKTVHYGFDLNNLMPQTALSGGGRLLVIGRDGAMIPLETGKDDLGFQIQRFKQVNAQAPLPNQMDRQNVFALRLVISNSSGKTIFSETYPLVQAP
ncbi:hypothetical protein JCM15519_24090 [Fundidesulfovibrio butyratiphilus]